MKYVGNPKHKEPWQIGRRGSLCPPEITEPMAKELLESSVESGHCRYANHNGRAYKAFEDHGTHAWHGFPVAWVEVPETIWRTWLRENEVTRAEIRRYWTAAS